MIGCLGLGMLLLCASIGFLLWSGFTAFRDSLKQAINGGFRELSEQTKVAFDFVINLEAGNIKMAYELTTEEFQSRHSMDEFEEFIAKHQELRQPIQRLKKEDLTEEELRAESCVYTITAATAKGREVHFQAPPRQGQRRVEGK